MSKAEQLGAGRFGGGISARRQAVAAATGAPTEGIAAPAELAVHLISLNPDNPRTALGDLTDLAASLKTHGQKVAVTVMNRDAYLKANPTQEDDLEPATTYVVVDGSSRLAAAREAGLTTLKVMVSDDQGATPEDLLESALVANIHRQDLEELDEARALQRLLTIHGSQRALAKRLHRSQGWVSQRLALLNLTPELQSRIGEEPIDLLRAVGNKAADQQETALEYLKAERARKEQMTRDRRQRAASAQEQSAHTSTREDDAETATPSEQETDDYAVITPGTASLTPTGPRGASTKPEAIPEPRTDSPTATATTELQPGITQFRKVPYDEPGPLAMLLDRNIPEDDTFFKLLALLCSKAQDRDPAQLHDLVRPFKEQAAPDHN